ncbi:MAG: glycosyltransferase [Opitutaceae bacterium]|jgi:hypothetical protein
MAVVRIFLVTYRRNRLLQRSLESLLAQTFTDWVCELHNDDPADPFPAELVARAGDPRITIHPHSTNWGAPKTFNHVFAGGPEPYASLLEDDNWWEPGFLASTLAAIESHPAASLVWANMHIWREETDGGWTDTRQTIWSTADADAQPRPFRWPEAIQAFDGLHSNGAMVFRPRAFHPMSVPPDTPLAIIEPVRERAATGELLLLPTPLANFALTLETARSKSRVRWLQSQLLNSTSFFEAVAVDDTSLAMIWARLRAQTPRNTNLLFLTAIALRRPRLLKPARPSDWLRFLLNFGRHPGNNLGGLRFRRDQSELWIWLRENSLPACLRTAPLLLDKQAKPPV